MLAYTASLLLFFAISTRVDAGPHCATLWEHSRGRGEDYRITPACKTKGPFAGRCIEETNFTGNVNAKQTHWNNKASSFRVFKGCTLRLYSDWDKRTGSYGVNYARDRIGEWKGDDTFTINMGVFGEKTFKFHEAVWINLAGSDNDTVSKFYCECPAPNKRRRLDEPARHGEEDSLDGVPNAIGEGSSSSDVPNERVLVRGLVGGRMAAFEVDVPRQTACDRDMCRLVKSEIPDLCKLKTVHQCAFSCCAKEVKKLIGKLE